MNHLSQTVSRLVSIAFCAAVLGSGTTALASTKDACSLVPLSQVQGLIGADGVVMSRPSGSKNGVTSSYCTYGSKAYAVSLMYSTFPSAGDARSWYAKMNARPGFRDRGYKAIKGAAVIMAYVNATSAANAEQKSFSRQLGVAMLSAI
ncbi:MAG: hypothetical protein M3N49_00250 [Candidatus Eremiobacteraeota bacterium]|nr:hypothetical protein [Candidatus Eremiobacteraeota bacterium]